MCLVQRFDNSRVEKRSNEKLQTSNKLEKVIKGDHDLLLTDYLTTLCYIYIICKKDVPGYTR